MHVKDYVRCTGCQRYRERAFFTKVRRGRVGCVCGSLRVNSEAPPTLTERIRIATWDNLVDLMKVWFA